MGVARHVAMITTEQSQSHSRYLLRTESLINFYVGDSCDLVWGCGPGDWFVRWHLEVASNA